MVNRLIDLFVSLAHEKVGLRGKASAEASSVGDLSGQPKIHAIRPHMKLSLVESVGGMTSGRASSALFSMEN